MNNLSENGKEANIRNPLSDVPGAMIIGLILIFVFQSCYKTDYYDGSEVNLRFSVDTLVFDTVFTTVGSATRILKVYNDESRVKF